MITTGGNLPARYVIHAAVMGQDTPLPSIEMSIEPGGGGCDGNSTLRVRSPNFQVAPSFRLPARPSFGPLDLMGAKYVPSIKDLKAAQRFKEEQARKARAKKAAVVPPPTKPKK